MVTLTQAQLARVRSLIDRAESRLAGAEAAANRPNPTDGEFDNNFDGVVSAIFHVVDAFELATTGLRREAREAEQATRIQSVVAVLRRDPSANVPVASRLVDLNRRRNTSVHGEWLEVLDAEALLDAIAAARALLEAVRAYLRHEGIDA